MHVVRLASPGCWPPPRVGPNEPEAGRAGHHFTTNTRAAADRGEIGDHALMNDIPDEPLQGGAIDALDRPPHTPIANVIQFYNRSTKRAEQSLPEYQKMYDEGIQVALKYFGE